MARVIHFLKPSYAHTFELSHTYNQFLTTTINYANTKDLFNETFEQKGYATIVKQGNFGRANSASISVSAQITVRKMVDINRIFGIQLQ